MVTLTPVAPWNLLQGIRRSRQLLLIAPNVLLPRLTLQCRLSRPCILQLSGSLCYHHWRAVTTRIPSDWGFSGQALF